MGNLLSIREIDESGFVVNEQYFAGRDFEHDISNGVLNIYPAHHLNATFSGQLTNVEINGVKYSDPEEATKALKFLKNFRKGGSTPLPTEGNHNELTGRDVEDCHPFWAITGLSSVLQLYYGIEFDINIANPECTRIGNMDLHRNLPIQSKIRRCLLLDDGSVNYYLHPNDSTLKEDGTPADLTGSDGMVMVEVPDLWIKFEEDGDKRRVLISEFQLPGFIKWSKDYVSAYEATVDRTASATPKLASVVNTTPSFRGGGNTTAEIAHDADGGTLLGKPAASISLTNFRTYARNRGSVSWNCNTYQMQRKLWWLFAVEYSNFNSQANFNASLTVNGYRQGGLGAGVTDLVAANIIGMTGGTHACIPCGITNSLGNKTGIVAYTMPPEYGAVKTTNVPSYRGVENPFGHLWKWADGCKCMIQADTDGGLSEFYVCDAPEDFTSTGAENYQLRGNLPRANTYVKEVILGEHGENMPLVGGASSTTYFCDYFSTSLPASGVSERGVLFGGHTAAGANAGFVCAFTNHEAANTVSSFGSLLCFINL